MAERVAGARLHPNIGSEDDGVRLNGRDGMGGEGGGVVGRGCGGGGGGG
jgi:hypothetical protein